MTTEIRERHATEAAATGKSGRLLIGIITPGWGSSGYYSQRVLENAAKAKVFPAGTHMYFDHPSESEMYDRPERSVRDLAAVLETDAVWDPSRNALVGEAQVFGPYVELLTDEHFAKAIGTSIIATAETTTGEAEGRKGTIISELVEGRSVDFVTHAGRGGSVLAVMESRRPERVVQRAVARGVEEATANETEAALRKVVRATYAGDNTYAWVRDFDDSTVWFQVEDETSERLFEQSYQLDANERPQLDGDPTEVRAKTVYIPVTTTAQEGTTDVSAPAGRTDNHSQSEEDNMGSIQVDEAEHRQITEAAGRVPALEAERDQAIRERDDARTQLATRDRREAAALIINATETQVPFTALERVGLLAQLPVTEAGELDAEKFKATCAEAAAKKAEEAGAGSTSGFGRTSGGGISADDFDRAMPGGKGQEG